MNAGTTSAGQEKQAAVPGAGAAGRWRLAWRNRDFYILLLPGLISLLLFKYTPMCVPIAFQDFNIFDGIAGSRWVGLEHSAS